MILTASKVKSRSVVKSRFPIPGSSSSWLGFVSMILRNDMKHLLLLAPLALMGCTQPDKAVSVLHAHGFSSITTTGYKLFACSEDDIYATGFEATSITGNRVEGVVCSGALKGATVRVQRVS